MTVENRAFALDAATKLNLGEADATVKAAQQYFAFLTGADAAAPAAATKPAATKPATKPTKPAKSEEEVVKAALEKQRQEEAAAEAGEEGAEGGEQAEGGDEDDLPATAEGVSAGIARLLKANKRKEAIATLKKFSATSASSVKPKDFAKFVAEVKKILSAEAGGDDLTA